MSKYYGNIIEDDTIELTFNTFDADGASVTVTDFASTDVHVHKDGGLTQTNTGVTIDIDFDGVTGNHVIYIDTSADAFYATGSNYEVRVEGITVATQTINAFIGSFSIENRYMVGTDGANTVEPDPAGTAAVPGDAMNLAADAIKAVSYDESTAFPLTAVNGSTLTEAGGTGDQLTAINLPNQTMDITGDITGNLSGSVNSVTTAVETDATSRTASKADVSLLAIDSTTAKETTLDSVETKVDTIISTGSTGPWTTGSGGDATSAKQDLIIQMQEADETFVPAAGTLTKYAKGTATEILKKNLKDPDGNAVDSTEDIIAATEDVAV